MMVKTEAYGEFGSGGKPKSVKQKSSIGKGKRDNNLPSTRSTTTSGANSCLISTHHPNGCFKNGSFFLPSSSLISSETSPEKSTVQSSWLITKKRWTGVRKKSFSNLTPFTFPKLKLKNSSYFSCNLSHVPPSAAPLARANLKFLFEKRLQKSDVGGLKRVILPKHPAESYLPTLHCKEGFFIWMDDMDGEHCWKFKFRYWPNNTSRMYVLENTGDFTDEHNLEEGDHILFYQDCDTKEYVVHAKKAKAPKDSYVEYEVQDSSSDFSNGTLDNDHPRGANSSQKKEEHSIVNYFVYEDGCSPEFHTDKVNNAVEYIPSYYQLFAPDEGEDGDDDIDKYLCLEDPESSKNSAVNAGSYVLPSEPVSFIKQDMKGKGVAHEDEGTSSCTIIGNASKVANNLFAVEHESSPKALDATTSSARTGGIPDDFFFYATDNIPGGMTYKVDEWGMPYGYETSLEKDPSLDFWATGDF